MAPRVKLTHDLISRAAQAALETTKDESLCRRIGISTTTYYAWRARGERELERIKEAMREDPEADIEPDPKEELFAEFAEATTHAREEMLDGLEVAAMAGALKNGHLALRILERRRPDEWAKRRQIEVTGKDGGPVQVSGGLEAAQALAQEVRRLAEAAGARPINDPESPDSSE